MLRMLSGNTEVIIGESRSLIRDAVYLSSAERVRTKSNYRPLLTHPFLTSILHYSTLSPGCRQTLTPTRVQRACTHSHTSTMHEVIKNSALLHVFLFLQDLLLNSTPHSYTLWEFSFRFGSHWILPAVKKTNLRGDRILPDHMEPDREQRPALIVLQKQ